MCSRHPSRALRRAHTGQLFRVSLAALGAALLVSPQPAWSWGTAEHVQFGMQIDDPFEQLFGGRLPVLTAWPEPDRPGPRTYGHWVSAPDFGRGLLFFLDRIPMIGPVACSALWSPEGVVDGDDFEDSMGNMIADDQPAPLANVGYADCLDSWRANNNHFGDFAAHHYLYHHALALEAARRYRSNRDPVCRAAAYTLEGWGQHFLTDTTAFGHAWTPPGTYDGTTYDWQTSQSAERMRIHDYLNDSGGRFAEGAFALGWMWGDHSERHTEDGASVPERVGTAQRALTLHLARIGLAQVVSVAECGGLAAATDIFEPRSDAHDIRRVYASDRAMCHAMWGHQILWWAPDAYTFLGLDLPAVRDAVERCRDDSGNLATAPDGDALARFYFQDAFYHANTEDGWINLAIDGQAELDLEALGCHELAEVEPLDAPDQRDLCGHLLCEIPTRADGTCTPPLRRVAGCCHEPRELPDGAAEIEMTSWAEGPSTANVVLSGAGATTGGTAAFLWLPERAAPFAGSDFAPLGDGIDAALTAGGASVDGCADEGSFSRYEARLRLPQSNALADTAVYLTVLDMDEGLEVTVDDHLARYVRRGDVIDPATDTPLGFTLALVDPSVPPADGDAYRIRLVHLNDCGAARPLVVSVDADAANKADDTGVAERRAPVGCSTGGTPSSPGLTALLCLLCLVGARRGR